jgi:hypothetical protein
MLQIQIKKDEGRSVVPEKVSDFLVAMKTAAIFNAETMQQGQVPFFKSLK